MTVAIEGNGYRPSHKGDGYSVSDVSYTLNHVEQHGVCYNSWDIQSKHIQPENGIAETLYSGECRYGGGESYVLSLEPGAASRVGGHIYDDNISGSLRAKAGDNQMSVCYGADIRNGKLDEEINGTLQAKSSGGWTANSNQVVCYGIDQQGGKGNAGFTEDVSPTVLSDSHGTPHAVCYELSEEEKQQVEDFISAVNMEAVHQQDLLQSDLGIARTLCPGTHASGSHLTKTLVTSAVCYGIGSYGSNAWKSGNPHSGVYEAETARSLDRMQCGNPSCHQGGMVVVEQK